MVFSNPTNITSIQSTLAYVNDATGQIFVPLIVLAIFFVTFIASKNYDTPRAFAFAAFMSFIPAVGFYLLDMLAVEFLMISIVALIFGVIYLSKAS